MKKCSDSCIPCCDYCIHCIHDEYEDDNTKMMIKGEPIKCSLHNKEVSGGYCKDFYCVNAKEE